MADDVGEALDLAVRREQLGGALGHRRLEAVIGLRQLLLRGRQHARLPPDQQLRHEGERRRDDQSEHDDGEQPVREARGVLRAFGEGRVLTRGHPGDELPYLHHGLAAPVGQNDGLRLRAPPARAEPDGLREFGELVPDRRPHRLEILTLRPVRSDQLAEATEVVVDLLKGAAVGPQVAIFARQQVAALSGLGVLRETERPDDLVLGLERGRDLTVEVVGFVDEPHRRAADRDQRDESEDEHQDFVTDGGVPPKRARHRAVPTAVRRISRISDTPAINAAALLFRR